MFIVGGISKFSYFCNSSIDNLNNAETFCWTDSEIALCWITGLRKERDRWVENRVTKIRSSRSVESWHHVPGSVNPADIATRPITPRDLNNNSSWFDGPRFLRFSMDSWPITKIDGNSANSANPVAEPESVITVTLSHDVIQDIIPVSNFSNIHRLVSIVAYCFRFKDNLLVRIKGRSPKAGDLSLLEIENAELYFLKNDQ